MEKRTKTVWVSDDGSELITTNDGHNFTVIPSSVTTSKLRELGKAIEDALSEPMVSAIRQARDKHIPNTPQ